MTPERVPQAIRPNLPALHDKSQDCQIPPHAPPLFYRHSFTQTLTHGKQQAGCMGMFEALIDSIVTHREFISEELTNSGVPISIHA
jgi:hypothetical protein